jgi:Flp pilus assembly pilin Flp
MWHARRDADPLLVRFSIRRRPEPRAADTAPDPSGAARRTGERGATLVEYALLVALLAVPTIGAIQLVSDGAQTKIEGTAAGISSHTIPPVP